MINNITGIVLAGGRARRMGGRDKGLLQLGGAPLAEISARRLAAQVGGGVFINANRHIAEYKKIGFPVVSDAIPDFAGPLAGLHAGMQAAKTEWVLTAPCDSPFFPENLAEKMFAAAADGTDVAVATTNNTPQPAFLLAKQNLHEDIKTFLSQADGKIANWYGRLTHAEVNFPNPASFDNINTAEDLQKAETRPPA